MITSEQTEIALVVQKEDKVQMIFNNGSKKAELFIAHVILLGKNLHIWLDAFEKLKDGKDCIVTKTCPNQEDAKIFFNDLIKTFKSLENK